MGNANDTKPAKHFIALSGDHDCIPDYCQAYVTRQEAVDSLAEMFDLGRTRKARLAHDGYLELSKQRGDGAEYAEITACDCGQPWQHGDDDGPENWGMGDEPAPPGKGVRHVGPCPSDTGHDV